MPRLGKFAVPEAVFEDPAQLTILARTLGQMEFVPTCVIRVNHSRLFEGLSPRFKNIGTFMEPPYYNITVKSATEIEVEIDEQKKK